jgi:hypothetical protein
LTASAVELDVCQPAHFTIPERDGSYLKAVEGVAAKLGRTLDATQRFAVDVLTSSWADGRPATLAAAVVCPRQNLKTFCLELIALTRLLRPGGDKLVVWSAHEVSTAQETFLKLVEYYEAEDEQGRPLYPWFAERVKSVSKATGRESITFWRPKANGKGRETCRLKFKARVKTGGRGLAGDLVILDEAFALTPEHMGSLLPILSTKAKGQILYGSSAPHATSTILHDVVKRGRAGRMAYLEWRAPGDWDAPGCTQPKCTHALDTPGCALDDIDMLVQCNPAAFHGRISREYLAGERVELAAAPAEFIRERMGYGESPAVAGGAISLSKWNECEDAFSQFVGRPVFAIAVSRDNSSAAIAAAGWRTDGIPHVEIVETGRGSDWVVKRCTSDEKDADGRPLGLKRHRPLAWVLDKKTPAAALLPDLKAAGIKPREMNTQDCGQACSALQRAVDDGVVRHLGSGVLNAAIQGAARRDIGDGLWAWSAKTSEVDIVTLVAATNALWGLSVTPKPRPLVAFK